MYVECNKEARGSAYKNWIMNLILEIRLLESQGKPESDHHGYCVDTAMGEMNWNYTTIFTYSIPLSENRGVNLFAIFIVNYFWKKNCLGCSRMGSDDIYPVNPGIFHVSWNKNWKLPLSWPSVSKVIVPMCSYSLSCLSVSYMNVSVESRRGDRHSRWHHHRCFLEPSCKVQMSWGLTLLYIIVDKLITRTNSWSHS